MRRVVFWVLGLTTVGGALAAVNARHDSRPVEVDWQLFRPPTPRVTVARPTRGPIARTIAAKGVVEPIHQVAVVSRVGGKVAEVLVAEGAVVAAGDPLVRLETKGFQARVDSAQTRLDTAAKNLGIAEAHLRDIEKDPAAATAPATPAPPTPAAASAPNLATLAGLRAATAPAPPAPPPPPGPTKLEAARDSADGWLRERKAAEVARDDARTELDRATVRAPIAGVVEDLAVAVGDDVFARPTVSTPPRLGRLAPAGLPGALVGGGSPVEGVAGPEAGVDPDRPLCAILDPDDLRVRAQIDEADVGLIHADQPVEVFLPDEPTTPVPGRIGRVAPRGRPSGEVVAYAATVAITDSRHRARVGMRVNIEVEVSRLADPLGVPVQAVLHRKRRDLTGATAVPESGADRDSGYVRAVFVLEGDRVRLRPIATGLSDERRVEITAGLASDDRVVVGPFRALDALEEGTVVALDDAPGEAASARLSRRADEAPPAGWGAPR